MGSSIAVSSYVSSLKLLSNDAVNSLYSNLPIILSFLAFFGLYQLVPNLKVRLSHSLLGALVATILFEVSKGGFAYYMAVFPSYHLIYGALAAVPILFVWVYLCWLIVLVGAEVTASLGEQAEWIDEVSDELYWLPKRYRKEVSHDSADSEGK
jgi:membrane protein